MHTHTILQKIVARFYFERHIFATNTILTFRKGSRNIKQSENLEKRKLRVFSMNTETTKNKEELLKILKRINKVIIHDTRFMIS